MINLILSNTKRSIEYVKALSKSKFNVNCVIIYSNKNINKILLELKKIKKIQKIIKSKNNRISDTNLSFINYLKKNDKNIIAAYPGEIINNKKLLKKKLIHCHPGNLPRFKGSTTLYYSLILKTSVYVSLIEINTKIDSGKILFKKKFKPPKNMQEIEKNYDNIIRAQTLISYLNLNKKKKLST